MQDHRSRIWLATTDDVFCFDGETFDSIRRYGLPRETVTSLSEDSDGGIWIGTNGRDGARPGGLYRYFAMRIEKIFTGDMRSIVAIGPGTMLVALGVDLVDDFGDLYRIQRDRGEWKPGLLKRAAAKYLTVDAEGTALYPCPGGWCELSRRRITAWPSMGTGALVHSLSRNPGIGRVLRDRSGCLWTRAGIAANYVCGHDDDSSPNNPPLLSIVPDGLLGWEDRTQIIEGTDGSMLLLDSGRIVVGRPNAFRTVSAANGMPVSALNTALIAQDGTIWLGCAGGLYRFMYPFRLEYWTQDQGVNSPYYVARIGDRVFASNAGISQLDRSRSHWNPWVSSRQVGTAVHLIPGPDKTIYAASLIRGMTQIQRNGRILARSNNGAGGARLASDGHGNTWLAGQGISLLKHPSKHLDLVPQIGAGTTSLDLEYERRHNMLWGCYGNEVVALSGSRQIHLTAKNGLVDSMCYSVAALPGGDVWVGYGFRTAISRIQPTTPGAFKVTTITPTEEPLVTNAGFLAADRRGWLWRASGHGDYVATPEAAARGDWLLLNTQDGIPVPGGNQNSFFSDSDGSIWFASDNTIVHFNPTPGFATDFPVPRVFLSAFIEGAGKLSPAEGLHRVSHGQNLTVRFGSMQFDRRNALRFRYRVLPEQRDWRETRDLKATLGTPRWGAHTLEFQGRLLGGNWSESQQTTFTVLRPAWLSWPALTLLSMATGSIALGLSQLRRQRRLQEAAVLPDLSVWRMSARLPEADSLVGTILDNRYQLDHILSVGGFSFVSRARDLRDGGKLRAVKIFRCDLADQVWMRHRFAQEVVVLEQLSHPNIVRITDHGTLDTGVPYLVMDFIEGRNLRQLLEEGPVPARTTGRLLRQVVGALDALHARAIYHRDLKPENLMIRSDGDEGEQLVVIDFSIAIVKSADETFHGISRVAGTLGYMAPEQVLGYADASTDIHALAKVLLEMLSGRRWTQLVPEGTLDMTSRVRSYLAEHPFGLSSDSVEMLACALAFDPALRPGSASAFARSIIRDLESAS